MTPFESFVVVAWSTGGDAVRIGLAGPGGTSAQEFGRRVEAEQALDARLDAAVASGERTLVGFDFGLGVPAGLAARLTGHAHAFAVWDWLEAAVVEGPDGADNRADVAERVNAASPGGGAVEEKAFTGLPVLARLRRRYEGRLGAWPFEDHALDRQIVLAEVSPVSGDVQGLAGALGRLGATGGLAALFAAAHGERLYETGWTLDLAEVASSRAADAALPQAPPLRDDCFALPRGVDWTPVDVALARLREGLKPAVGVEETAVDGAEGRFLAGTVTALRANPPAANAAVDGYGFAHSGVAGPLRLPLLAGRAAAGAPYGGRVPTGAALRILTGALLPEGVDTVVLEEDAAVNDGFVAFEAGLKPGANTRRAGEDVAAGAPLFAPGHRLRPADLALLSAVGVARVPVRRRLTVAVLSTGDEIAPPGTGSGADPARTYDANRPMLLALVRRWGYRALDLGHVGDDRAALRDRLDRAAGEAQALLTTGGASAGDEDHVSALLSEAGALETWRIAVKPGRPLALGRWGGPGGGMAVFGLPGNPVAAFVCALIFARPALTVLAGGTWPEPVGFAVPAAFEKRKKAGRREFLRARLTADGRAEVFESEGSGRISGLTWAEGLVELPDEAAHVRPGDPVRYLPYGSFGV